MNAEDWVQVGATVWFQTLLVLGVGLMGARLLRRRGPLAQMLALRGALLGVALSVLMSLLVALPGRALWNRKALVKMSLPAPTRTPRFSPRPAPRELPMLDETQGEAATHGKEAMPIAVAKASEAIIESTANEKSAVTASIVAAPTWGSIYRSAALAWLAGALLGLSWLALCALRLAKVRRMSTHVAAGEWCEVLREVCASNGWRVPVLVQSDDVGGPLLMGLRRPCIVLPREDVDDRDKWNPESRRAVLIHEMTHLQRGDVRWMCATRLACAVLWPQPLLWMLSRRMEGVAEDVCDQAVVDGGCTPKHYARCLLELAERLTLRRGERTLAAGVVPRQSALGQRVRRILNSSASIAAPIARSLRASVGVATLGAVILAACVVAVKSTSQIEEIFAQPLSPDAKWNDAKLPKREPFRVQSQTVDGVTMRVTDARWQKEDWYSSFNEMGKNLAVRYQVSSPNAKVKPARGKRLLDYVTQINSYDAFGDIKRGSVWEPETPLMRMSGLDPRLDFTPLEFEFRDPAAPPFADGRFVETVEFNHVPLPRGRDIVLHINRSALTKRGTRVFLNAVAIASAHNSRLGDYDSSRLLMSVCSLPPNRTPDMTAYMNLSGNSVFDSSGKNLTGPNHFGNGWSGHDDLEDRADSQTLLTSTVPPPTSRFVNIKMTVQQEAPSLKQNKWFRHFRFQLPQNQLPLGKTTARRPVAIATSTDVDVTLDSIDKNGGRFGASILAVGKNPEQWEWRVDTAKLREDGGPSQRGDRTFSDIFWKRNGQPLAAGEQYVQFGFSNYDDSGKLKTRNPRKLELRVEMQAEHRVAHDLVFRKLPIPRNGRIAQADQTVVLPSGARVSIARIEIATFDRSDHAMKNRTPTRLAVTYDVKGRAPDVSLDYEKNMATDDKGRRFNANGVTQWGQTLYYTLPARDAKTFDLHLLASEVTIGPRKIVTFRNLKAPRVK